MARSRHWPELRLELRLQQRGAWGVECQHFYESFRYRQTRSSRVKSSSGLCGDGRKDRLSSGLILL